VVVLDMYSGGEVFECRSAHQLSYGQFSPVLLAFEFVVLILPHVLLH
jgi:hypothetical protein